MSRRLSYRVVTFRHPFTLRGIGREQPAGSYTIETGEDLIALAAHGQGSTAIFLPSRPGGGGGEIARIDPHELEAAQERDAMGP
jgi:hypothetical protein